MLNPLQHRTSWSACHVVALIVDADEIKLLAPVLERRILLAQQSHAITIKQPLGGIFRVCINLVIPIAAPRPQWGAELAQFCNTSLKGVVLAADEISGDNCEIRAKSIGHLYGPAHF